MTNSATHIAWPPHADASTAPTAHASLLGSFLGWPLRFGQMLAGEIRYRRDVAALLQLDDRLLKDIGLDRSQIISVVREGGLYPPR